MRNIPNRTQISGFWQGRVVRGKVGYGYPKSI